MASAAVWIQLGVYIDAYLPQCSSVLLTNGNVANLEIKELLFDYKNSNILTNKKYSSHDKKKFLSQVYQIQLRCFMLQSLISSSYQRRQTNIPSPPILSGSAERIPLDQKVGLRIMSSQECMQQKQR